MTKRQLELGGSVPPRTVLYGGALDLVNGDHVSSAAVRDLKFAALFYRHIVVPDGFFHCHGPLLTHLKRLTAESEATRAADSVLKLLDADVIVPVIRDGDSLLNNWRRGEERGVVPGTYLIAAAGEADSALELADRHARSFAAWPTSMTPAAGSRFWEAAFKALLDEESPYCITLRDPPPDLPLGFEADWHQSQNLLDAFEKLLRDNSSNPRFRRGDIECLVRDAFCRADRSFTLNSYQSVVDRVDWELPVRRPLEAVGYYLLSVASTAYEAFQAAELRTTAGLFQQHDSRLIDGDILSTFVDIDVTTAEVVPEHMVHGSLNLDRLNVADIIRFRGEATDKEGNALFERYCQLVADLKVPADGASFANANPDFIRFITDDYLDALFRMFPEAGYVQRAAEVTGDAASLVSGYLGYSGAGVTVEGRALIALLGGTGVILRRSAPYIQSITQYLIGKRRVRTAARNNYDLWYAPKAPRT